MNSKEYLEQAIRLEQEMRALLEESEKFRQLAEGAGAIRYDREGSHTQRSQNAPFEMPLITAQDLENQAKAEHKELWEKLREIRLTISHVEDDQTRIVLRKRFLINKTPEEIAHDLRISKSTVLRRLDDGYKAVSDLTGLPLPPMRRMPGRERHHIAREMIREVMKDED